MTGTPVSREEPIIKMSVRRVGIGKTSGGERDSGKVHCIYYGKKTWGGKKRIGTTPIDSRSYKTRKKQVGG